jgi:GNAT superfamily N-acetyltransferase
MHTVYYKRFRMEIDLRKVVLPDPDLPDGYHWTTWQPEWLERHAWTKAESFRDEIDADVFASLADYGGCLNLMREIVRRDGFCPQATWLITRGEPESEDREDCGTIQGLVSKPTGLFASGPVGAIQNIGITPRHRGQGLGRALVLRTLWGYRGCGLLRAFLEVTARNEPAVRLYRSLGFRLTGTSYKAVTRRTPAGMREIVWT